MQSRRPRVLIVDDELALVELAEPTLSAEGYEVRSTTQATMAIEIAVAFKPDLAMLGLIMPVDGIQLGKQILDLLPKTKVMLWAEIDGSEDLRELRRNSYDFALLPTPFEERELVRKVGSLIHEHPAAVNVQTLSDSVGTPYSRNLATAESFDKPYSVTEREKWEWAIAEEKRAALRKHEEEQKPETEKSAWVGVIVIILIAALWIWMTSRQPGAGDCPDSLSPTGCVTP
jgi:DNA-binding response OmpR family regulator